MSRIECDGCFLLTAREAERRSVVPSAVAIILCDRHDGRHNIKSWVESDRAGWFQCACGEQFITDGFDSEEQSMGALFVAHAAGGGPR